MGLTHLRNRVQRMLAVALLPERSVAGCGEFVHCKGGRRAPRLAGGYNRLSGENSTEAGRDCARMIDCDSN